MYNCPDIIVLRFFCYISGNFIVKFEIYNEGKPAEKFSLEGAYLFGVDGVPLKGHSKIVFNKGGLDVSKSSNDSAGISVMWTVKGFGRIMLPTTRLPDRKQPYNLNVELARAKLMEITIKREDWSFLDESSEKIKEVKNLFVQALEKIDNPPVAAVMADECLKKTIMISEVLAAKNAEIYLKAKLRSSGYGKHCMGCVMDPDRAEDKKYIEKLTDNFGFISIPVSWRDVEGQNGEFDHSKVDKCFNAIKGKKVAISVGPLLNFDKQNIPNWLIKEDHPFEKIRESAYNYVNEMVSRYGSRVHAWRVISGLNAENYFGFNFEQILEMTRAGIMSARAVDTKSIKIVEIIHPWGEYYSSVADTVPPLVYIDMLMQVGANPDAIGVSMCFGKNKMCMRVRDMMQISAMLDRLVPIGKPIHLANIEVPGDMEKNGNGSELSNGGIWRNKWKDSVQAKWIEHFYKIALGKPFINTITYSQFADDPSSRLTKSGLVTKDLKDKEAILSLKKIQKTLIVPKR